MNDYEIGSFGEASFRFVKKDFKGFVKTYGTIKAIEKKFVLFEDNDNYLYLVDKKDFNFTVEKK